MAVFTLLRNMTAAIFFSLTLPLPASCQTQVMHTHVATLASSPEEVAQSLSTSTDDLAINRQGDLVMLAYAGNSVPSDLVSLLTSAFPELDKTVFRPGQSINFSVALIPVGSGTQLRLMMFQAQDESSVVELPAGSEMLINDGYAGDCTGQIVASYSGSASTAIPVYSEWLTAEGFEVADTSDASTSFFIGNKTGCSVFVYIQPDPEAQQRSTVVVRYLED